jgi:hypothetical protein
MVQPPLSAQRSWRYRRSGHGAIGTVVMAQRSSGAEPPLLVPVGEDPLVAGFVVRGSEPGTRRVGPGSDGLPVVDSGASVKPGTATVGSAQTGAEATPVAESHRGNESPRWREPPGLPRCDSSQRRANPHRGAPKAQNPPRENSACDPIQNQVIESPSHKPNAGSRGQRVRPIRYEIGRCPLLSQRSRATRR